MIAINFDWSTNFNENGEERFNLSCPNIENHEEDDESCDICENGYLQPMMNYLYPLDYTFSDVESRALKVAQETNCILVQYNNTEEWFLALTGGGMDLSPDIAYAYYLAQKWLPTDLLHELNAGWCKDSLSPKKFKILRRIVREQLKNERRKVSEKTKEWGKTIKEITQ